MPACAHLGGQKPEMVGIATRISSKIQWTCSGSSLFSIAGQTAGKGYSILIHNSRRNRIDWQFPFSNRLTRRSLLRYTFSACQKYHISTEASTSASEIPSPIQKHGKLSKPYARLESDPRIYLHSSPCMCFVWRSSVSTSLVINRAYLQVLWNWYASLSAVELRCCAGCELRRNRKISGELHVLLPRCYSPFEALE